MIIPPHFGRNAILSLLCTAALALAGCGLENTAPKPVEKAKIVIPDPEQSVASASASGLTPDVTQEVLTPKVPVRKEDNLLQAINVNLDLDQSEEQILVLKDKDNPDSPIRVEVADFDSVRNEYVDSWEAPTGATNIRTFNVTTEDIVGDHTPEIICSGMNSKGEQTIDIFRKTHPPTGVNLYYTEIFKVAVKGKIEIESHDRTQAYKLGQKNGTSFSIVTYTQDPNSEHIGDLIKTTYNWKYQTNTYVQTDQEKIPGKQIADQRLNALYSQGADAFESFLAGPWFKTSDNGGSGGTTDPTASDAVKGTTILYFDPKSREITFYAGDVMEVYSWDNSYRTLFNGLVISAYNELVQYIKAQISLSVTSIDKIEVYSPDEWKGTYQKLTEGMQQNLIRQATPAGKLPTLSGEFTSATGATLDFREPDFSLSDGGQTRIGGFSVFDFGVPVIELRFVQSTGIVTETASYKLAYAEQKSPSQITRTITLTPGILGIRGFTPNGDPPLRYEQVQVLDAKTTPAVKGGSTS